MRSKVVTMEEALSKFKDGQTIMFGDWHGEFSAEEIITGMLEKGVKDIHAIAVSGGMPDQGVGEQTHPRPSCEKSCDNSYCLQPFCPRPDVRRRT